LTCAVTREQNRRNSLDKKSLGDGTRAAGPLPLAVNELHLKVTKDKRHFFFVPFGIDCGTEETSYCNDEKENRIPDST
jgi:hypothetical protein